MKDAYMKAMVSSTYGSPEVLKLLEVKQPIPTHKEVLVKVHATTVNRTDCGFLRGKPFIVRFFSGLRKPKNPILGNEFAGEVEAIGKDVASFRVGDKVFGYSDVTFGAHAAYIAVDEDGPISIMPSNMGYEEVVPSTEGVHYALTDIRAANVQPGQRVLINGATGAIGSAAVQLVRYYGAHVTAVCSTPQIALVKSLGADDVIDYLKDDFTARPILKKEQLYDFVFDAVGKSSFGACKKLLKPNGIYCSTELGYMSQNPFLALWSLKFGSKKVIFPLPKNNKKDVLFFKELLETGKFKPLIDRRYPLEALREAYTYVETGQKIGNVVITIQHTA